MPIRTQLLKKWAGPDPEKHIGSTPLMTINLLPQRPCCTEFCQQILLGFYRATLCQCGICSRRVSICSSVRPSVCLSQAGILSKRLDESSWFLACRLPAVYPTLCYREMWVSPKIKILPAGTLSKLGTQKISPQQVDRVVNKTRRRRRSSLLTTPIRQSTLDVDRIEITAMTPESRSIAVICNYVIFPLLTYLLTTAQEKQVSVVGISPVRQNRAVDRT